MKELLEEYRETLRLTRRMKEEATEADQKIYAGIISNLEYAVKWLREEQQPATPKRRVVRFSKPEYVDMFDLPDPFNFNGCPYEEVERRLDAERGQKSDSRRRNLGRFRRKRF